MLALAEMKMIKENMESLDWIYKLSPEMFISLIGTMLDSYEATHEDFDTVKSLEMLCEISKGIHAVLGKMEVD